MKKKITAAFCAFVCLLAFAGCSQESKENIVDRESEMYVTSEERTAEKDITGKYGNTDYSMTVTADDDGLFTFEIRTMANNNMFYEWKMTGYSGNGHINYSDAEKYIITCDKNDTEKSRETEYVMGGGRFVFEEDGSIVWNDSMETTAGNNKFTKQS